MKLFIAILMFLLSAGFSHAQQFPYWEDWNKTQADSLRLIWNTTTNDTLRMGMARSLFAYYIEIKLDSGLYYSQQELALARKLKQKLWEADALDNIGYSLSSLKDFPGSLQAFLSALKIAEDQQTESNVWQISRFSKNEDQTKARLAVLVFCYLDLGRLYSYTGNVKQQFSNHSEALRIAHIVDDPSILSNVYSNLGKDFAEQNKLDSALILLEKSIHYYDVSGFKKYKGGTLSYIGLVYAKNGNYKQAKQYFTKAMQESRLADNITDLSVTCLYISDVFSQMAESDSSLWYAYKGFEYAQLSGSPGLYLPAYTTLASTYKLLNNIDSAYYYQGLALALKDSINNIDRLNQFQNIGFNEQVREQELEKERIEYQNKIRTNTLSGGLFTLTIIAFLLYRNNRQKQKAKLKIENAFDQLKSTQSQLIQSEKMASLGELTAGIAHEIQNPLNFVNNFSEVNKELADELEQEIDKGNYTDAKLLAKDIKANEEKINHHGKRADAIVKGMLQHSRTSTGQKELTDINALCDEYLRLSYHGLRAKDKSFNAKCETDFEASLPKLNVVPQDIGRVILNLINNAFYVVNEKKNSGVENYEPTVSVSTKKAGDKVLISVKDNGIGIPDSIKEKIFQPFFTTKPTGQGTGLGLSLSYDIVKAHGGELKVETKPDRAGTAGDGEGSEFIIIFPLS